MSQNIEDYDEEDIDDLVDEFKLYRSRLLKKQAFFAAAGMMKNEKKALQKAGKAEDVLKELGEDVLKAKIKTLSKFFTRVKAARKARKMMKKKSQAKAAAGVTLTSAQKRAMSSYKAKIPTFCRIIGINDEWSKSRDFKTIKEAHADLRKRSTRTVHLRNLKDKWVVIFVDEDDAFPDETEFPKTGDGIEEFYQSMKSKYDEKRVEIAQDKRWNKTYEKRADKLFENLATHDSKDDFRAFSRDMRFSKNIKNSDFNLWKLEKDTAMCGLLRREEYSDLRLDTVSIKRENLMKLLKKHQGTHVEKLQDLGIVRTSYGKIVKFDDDFMPKFPAPKKKGKKRKNRDESEEEEEEALQVCLLVVFCLIFCVFLCQFSDLFRNFLMAFHPDLH